MPTRLLSRRTCPAASRRANRLDLLRISRRTRAEISESKYRGRSVSRQIDAISTAFPRRVSREDREKSPRSRVKNEPNRLRRGRDRKLNLGPLNSVVDLHTVRANRRGSRRTSPRRSLRRWPSVLLQRWNAPVLAKAPVESWNVRGAVALLNANAQRITSIHIAVASMPLTKAASAVAAQMRSGRRKRPYDAGR